MSAAYHKIKPQYGLTLVELMIALVLGLLLLGGVIQIFLSSRQSYQLQDGLSRLQENGRFAMDVVTLNLRHAGFKADALTTDDLAFTVNGVVYAPANVDFSRAGQVVVGTDNNASNDVIRDGTDTISFRFQGSPNIPAGTALRDCLNATPASGVVAVNWLYVRTPELELHCRSEAGGGDDQPLLDGVENMQILYGVDTNGDRIANRYSTAATVTANNEWTRIVSVRVALLLSTVQAASSDPDASTYTLLNATAGPFNDQLRRHVFTTSIALRNVLP